jgi:hypothetical protein
MSEPRCPAYCAKVTAKRPQKRVASLEDMR